MAKLSAHGRIELARVYKEKTMPEIISCDSCQGSGRYLTDLVVNNHVYHKAGDECIGCNGKGKSKPSTCWERRTRTLMSDGKILEKFDCHFNDERSPKGYYPHSYGWKVFGKAKKDITKEKFVEIHTNTGWSSK